MTPPGTLAPAHENKALVTRLFDEVFGAENLDAADEIFAEDGTAAELRLNPHEAFLLGGPAPVRSEARRRVRPRKSQRSGRMVPPGLAPGGDKRCERGAIGKEGVDGSSRSENFKTPDVISSCCLDRSPRAFVASLILDVVA